MAPKRSAPQPPPPAASSEETASGTGSEETDEEEEIAYSPPPAAPKNPAPPPQEAQESEGEDDDEEEEEDDEEEEEDDDGEEDEKAIQVGPPPVTKNPPSPPPNHEESETSDEEGDEETDEEGDEETDEDAPQPQPQPASVQEAAERKTAKPPSPMTMIEFKKPSAPFQRTWSTDDEVRILEALDAHRAEDGTLPQADALVAALAGSLDNSGCSASDLQKKLKSLKSRYSAAAKKGELPSKDHDRRLFELSKKAWGSVATAAAANKGGTLRDVSEMRELYPYLAEEVNALEKAHRGLFKREFAMISDDKARALDLKIKKSRLAQMKLYQRRHDLTKEVTKTLIDLAEH